MKAIFGGVSLLVVLAIVGLLASRQMKAVRSDAGPAPAVPVRQQSPQVQDKVFSDVNKALEQGAARREEAEK